jgi:hypothetical protein
MRSRPVRTAALVFFFLLPPLLSAQDYDGPRCAKCKTTGRLENKYCTPAIAAMEEKVLHCSYVFEKDKKGHGHPWLPCLRCRSPELAAAAQRDFDEIMGRRKKWLTRRRQVDEMLKTDLLHLETEHFVIAWDIPKIVTKNKKVYRCHEALHLYAERMEEYYRDFMGFFGIDEKEIRNKKHFVYLYERQKHCLKTSKEYTGLNCWNAAKLPGNPSILVSWYDKTNFPKEADLHRHLIHHLSHLFNVSYYRMEWLAATAGWADEGLAHFMEYRYFNRADNTCDEEGEEEIMSHSDWEYEVRVHVVAGKGPSFAELCNKSVTSLSGVEHKLVWSYMDFLFKCYKPERFKDFMKVIKAKRPSREALKEAYGLNVIAFQKKWEAYVLKNYREKPLKTATAPRRNRR